MCSPKTFRRADKDFLPAWVTSMVFQTFSTAMHGGRLLRAMEYVCMHGRMKASGDKRREGEGSTLALAERILCSFVPAFCCFAARSQRESKAKGNSSVRSRPNLSGTRKQCTRKEVGSSGNNLEGYIDSTEITRHKKCV